MTKTPPGTIHEPLASSRKNPKRLFDLPAETIHLIFDQFENYELPTLMGVSRDFHDLAAAQLYRSIEYTFSDEENEHPVDLLAGVLETLASSEYSYASFVKEIHVTSTALGDRGERAYRDYLYTSSCGKFLNLTLLTVLKRVTVLESFDWDVRIELSPSVFSCLSNISSLRYLRVRLQAGRSLHSRSWTPHGNASIPNSHPPPPSGWNNAVVDAKVSSRPISGKRSKATASFSRFRNLTSFSALEIDTLEYVPELAKCIHASSKSLKRLALSFSENLARKAKEIQGGNSDTELTLSDGDLSDTGVQSSHHGNQEHSAETWQMARDAQEAALARMLGLQSLSESNPNATAVDKMVSHADKEVFDQLKQAYRKEKDKEFLSSIRNIMKTTSGLSDKKDSRSYRLVDRLERAATKYLESGDFSTKELRKRKDASVDKMMPKKPSPKPPKPYHYSTYTSGTQPGLSPGTYIPHQQPDEMWVTSNGTVLPTAGPSQPHHYSIPGPSSMSSKYFAAPASNWVPLPQKHPIYGPGYHLHPEASHTVASSSKSKKSIMSTSSSSSLLSGSSAQAKSSSPDPLPKPKERSPSSHQKHGDEKSVKTYDDGIDIDHPDDLGEDVEDQEFIENHATNIVLNETLELNKPESSDHNLPNGTALSPDSSLPSRQRKGKEVVRDQNSSFGSDRRVTNTFENSSESSSSTTKPESSSMTEYLRLSHGLALESIKLHRIPVKPSVLFRAVDVSRLKHLTLLDVGPQRAAWAMLSKLNKTSSLQLEIINTNNVTHSLLVFLNGLEPGKLQELYLLEPSSRHRSANTRKTLVTIREIRKQVLKKHIETLRILMIRNDDDNSWCLDREATRVLSRGSKLRELVVAMSSETFHLFLRHFPRLGQLHALHVIYQAKSYQYSGLSQTANNPPNPVNMVVNPPPPIAMPPAHPPSQYPSSTRMAPQAKEALLLELRAAIIDAVALCQQTELEWVGLSYGSIEARGDARVARLFNWRSEKDSDNGSESEEPDGDTSSIEDGYMDDVIGLEDWIPMAEAEAEIWDKGLWTGKL